MFTWLKLKKEDPTYGPFFLKGEYPAGFQPRQPEASLTNAFVVIRQINEDLKAKIGSAATPDSLGRAAVSDFQQSQNIITDIDGLIIKIDEFKKYLAENSLLELNKKSGEVIAKVEGIVTAVMSTTENLLPTGTQSAIAFDALADVLQITRRSIPGIDVLKEYKESINNTRTALLETIETTKAVNTSNFKAQLSAMKEAEKGADLTKEHPSDNGRKMKT